jgi:hypothetical protein
MARDRVLLFPTCVALQRSSECSRFAWLLICPWNFTDGLPRQSTYSEQGVLVHGECRDSGLWLSVWLLGSYTAGIRYGQVIETIPGALEKRLLK